LARGSQQSGKEGVARGRRRREKNRDRESERGRKKREGGRERGERKGRWQAANAQVGEASQLADL
jgi:hypothetical protein